MFLYFLLCVDAHRPIKYIELFCTFKLYGRDIVLDACHAAIFLFRLMLPFQELSVLIGVDLVCFFFHWDVVFHCVNVLQVIYPFPIWWTLSFVCNFVCKFYCRLLCKSPCAHMWEYLETAVKGNPTDSELRPQEIALSNQRAGPDIGLPGCRGHWDPGLPAKGSSVVPFLRSAILRGCTFCLRFALSWLQNSCSNSRHCVKFQSEWDKGAEVK